MNKNLINPIKWVLVERILQILIALLFNIILARYLGVEQFGILQAALSTVAVFSSIGLLCSAEVVSPLYSQNTEKYSTIFEQVFIIRLCLSVIAVAFISFYLYFGNHQNVFLMICLIVGILFQEPFNIFGLYFQVEGKQRIFSKIRLYGIFLKLSIAIIFIQLEVDAEAFGLPYLFEYIFVAFLLFFGFKKIKKTSFFIPKLSFIKNILLKGLVFGVGIAAMIAMQKLDRIVLNVLEKNIELGVYSAAIQIAENWFLMSSILIQAIVAKFIYQMKNSQANNNIIKLLFMFLLISVIAAIVGLVLGDPVMNLLYGNKFEGSGYYLSFLLFVAIFVFSDAVLTTKILKNKDGYAFSLKWIISLIAVLIYIFISIKYFNKFKVEYIPAIGYGVAMLFSLVYFLKKKNEDYINNL